jgi:hypothetical protein
MPCPPVQFLPLGTRGPAFLGSRVRVCRGEEGCCETAWLGWVLTSYSIAVSIVVTVYCYVGGGSRLYTRTISGQSRFYVWRVGCMQQLEAYTGCTKWQGAFRSKREIV